MSLSDSLSVPTVNKVEALQSSYNWNQWGMVWNASGGEGQHTADGICPICNSDRVRMEELLKDRNKHSPFRTEVDFAESVHYVCTTDTLAPDGVPK